MSPILIQVHLYSMTNAPVKISKRIPFDLCDPVGILFYGSIFTLVHQALEEALPKIGISWKEWFDSEIGAPIRHVECDYLRPLKANDMADIEVHFESPSDTSITVHYIVKKGETVYCDVKAVKVFVNRSTMTKASMPEKYKKIFNK